MDNLVGVPRIREPGREYSIQARTVEVTVLHFVCPGCKYEGALSNPRAIDAFVRHEPLATHCPSPECRAVLHIKRPRILSGYTGRKGPL